MVAAGSGRSEEAVSLLAYAQKSLRLSKGPEVGILRQPGRLGLLGQAPPGKGSPSDPTLKPPVRE